MSRIHPEQPTATLSRRKATELLAAIREVFAEALAEGGTSFDAQYLNVNGESGYFSRRLKAYGRQGEPCLRCGRPIVREIVHEPRLALLPPLPEARVRYASVARATRRVAELR